MENLNTDDRVYRVNVSTDGSLQILLSFGPKYINCFLTSLFHVKFI